MRLTIIIISLFIISCEDCNEEKNYTPELFPCKKTGNKDYDWNKISETKDSLIHFGIGTEYRQCDAYGVKKIKIKSTLFYCNRELTVNNKKINPKENLLTEDFKKFINIIEKKNSPQYIIKIRNNYINLKGYYTFYFESETTNGIILKDSTIINIKE